ncbi:MAG TPA: EutN/CcmL family microcompartment protein [Verrucomicrobiae bacterium]|jgi:microcompartment protein CcmK/EutM
MLLARVEGNVVATRKHPSFEGWRFVLCQPINQVGQPEGSPQVAIDAHGAGMHQRVILTSDGSAARLAVKDPKSPARWMVLGIVDEEQGAAA